MSKEKRKQACSALKQLQVEPEHRDGPDPQRKTASRSSDASLRNRMLGMFTLKKRDFVALGKQSLVILAFWLFGVVNLFHPLLFSLNLGDIGDTRLNLYALEHQFRVITDSKYPGQYGTAPFWYPESENNMASSDMLTGAQPLYFLPRLFLQRDSAYQVFFVLWATFNFLVFFWLLRSLRVETLVAGLAACVFAFGMHKVQHMVHVQLYVQFWGALCLVCLIHFLKSPARPTLFCAVLLLGLQTLTSPYSGVFYCIGGVLLIVLHTLIEPKAARAMFAWCRHDFFAMVGLVVTAIAPVAILLSPYWRNAQAFQRRAWAEVSLFLPDPSFWINPLQGTLWWFVKRLAGMSINPGESHFIGFIFILLAICSGGAFVLYRPWRAEARSRLALVLLVLAIALVLLVSQFGEGKTPWWMLYNILPGANGIRDVRRISIVANFGLIVSGALFLGYLVRRSRSGIRRILLAICVSVTLLENCTILSLIPAERWRQWDTGKHFRFYDQLNGMYSYARDWYEPQSADMAELIQNAGAAYVFNDPQVPDFAHENNVKLVGQQVNTPVMNGLSGSSRPGYRSFMGPREVMEKGTKFDFRGFAYLVPLPEEARMQNEFRRSGLSFVRRGRYFSLYQPYAQERGYDVNFQIFGVPPSRLRPNEQTSVLMLVTNRSFYPWQPFGLYPTWPAYRILVPHTERDVGDGMRTPLQDVLFPGESALVRLVIKAPEQQGAYIIRPTMVQERCSWFGPKDRAHIVQFPLSVE